MANSRDCIAALARAAGRVLTDDEVAAVFERIHKAALDIKAGRAEVDEVGMPKGGKKTADLRKDIEGQGEGKTANAVIQQAAERAAREIEIEAGLTIRDAHLQIAAIGARMSDIDGITAAGLKPIDALDRAIFRDYTGKLNVTSLEQHVTGHELNLLSQLTETWKALGDDFLEIFQDRVKMLDLIKEIRGEDTGNAMAKKGARAWNDTAEQARRTFNEAGGKVGKLDEGYLPQHHSQERVAAAGQQEWTDQIIPYLDRQRYVDEVSGQAWDDATMREFLGHAWSTIATNGIANLEPGKSQGVGKRANRHRAHRQIHFKDAESLIAYWEMFGDRSFMEIAFGHITTMAKDIGLIEWGGPNPHLTYQTLRDDALKKASVADPVNTKHYESKVRHLDTYYDYVTGRRKPPLSPWLRRVSQGIANLNVAGKLGSSAITSFFGDKPMFEAVAHLSNLPKYKLWTNELALMNPANASERRMLQRNGLMLDSIMSNLHRFGDDLGHKRGITGKLANAVMSMTGMQLVNDARKGAFELTLQDSIGYEISRGVEFDQLHNSDIRILKTFGVTERDWNTWKLAKLEDYKRGNHTLLTPEAIRNITDDQLRQANIIGQVEGAAEAEKARRDAVVKLLGAVHSEGDFAVITPGYKERAVMYAAAQPGTWGGEIWKSALQFKSFPFTAFRRSMDAIANKPTGGGKAGMTAGLLVGTTLAGAMIMQVKETLSGKDPRKMFDENWMKFWGSAFVYGGALGFYGDFIYSANRTRYGSGPVEALSGPTLGPLLELALVQPLGAIRKVMEGEESSLASQTVMDLKSYMPMNNAWYSKAAIDHLVWQNVMETANPGYLRRMKRNTRKEFDQKWWWEPGTNTPQRLPDIKSAFQ